jgi:hypothetical protein
MKPGDLSLDRYRFAVRPMTADRGMGYRIGFPDVQVCMSDSAAAEEATANGCAALAGCLLTRRES